MSVGMAVLVFIACLITTLVSSEALVRGLVALGTKLKPWGLMLQKSRRPLHPCSQALLTWDKVWFLAPISSISRCSWD